MTVQFQVGRTYSDSHTGDSQLFEHFTILSRTAKTITTTVNGETVRRGVYVHNGVEQFKPFGSYSMAMIVNANDKDLSKPAKPVSQDDDIRARLEVAKPALDYAQAVREHVIKVNAAEAIALAEAAQAMLKALKAVYGCPQAAPYLTRGPAHGVDAWLMVRHAIAQAEAAGITATEAED